MTHGTLGGPFCSGSGGAARVRRGASGRVSIPSADRLDVRPGPTGADAEQQAWLGEHVLTR